MLKRLKNWWSWYPVSLFYLPRIAKPGLAAGNNESILNWKNNNSKNNNMVEFDLRVLKKLLFWKLFFLFLIKGVILDYFIYCILGYFVLQKFICITFLDDTKF